MKSALCRTLSNIFCSCGLMKLLSIEDIKMSNITEDNFLPSQNKASNLFCEEQQRTENIWKTFKLLNGSLETGIFSVIIYMNKSRHLVSKYFTIKLNCVPWMLSICPILRAAPLTLHSVFTILSALASDRRGESKRAPISESERHQKCD